MVKVTVKNEDGKEMNIKGDIAFTISQTEEKDGFSIGMALAGSASTLDLIRLRTTLLTEAKRRLDDEILGSLLKDSTEDEFKKAIDSIEDENVKNVILEYVKSKGGQA